MVLGDIIIISVMISIILMIIAGIRYILNRNIERNLINIVLSKLDFCPTTYKIDKRDNKIYIKCHMLFNNKYIYNDASLGRTNHIIFNGGLKIVDIIIDLKEKKYKIIVIAFHIINTSADLYEELKIKLNKKDYYFINNIIDLNFNIDTNDVSLCNIEVPDLNSYMYIYNETSNYDKYMCNRYSVLLTNDIDSVYINSISTTFPNNTMEPLLTNEIRIKEFECRFL
jgi:hypothetical protein